LFYFLSHKTSSLTKKKQQKEKGAIAPPQSPIKKTVSRKQIILYYIAPDTERYVDIYIPIIVKVLEAFFFFFFFCCCCLIDYDYCHAPWEEAASGKRRPALFRLKKATLKKKIFVNNT
jgi:hypothetical protein